MVKELQRSAAIQHILQNTNEDHMARQQKRKEAIINYIRESPFSQTENNKPHAIKVNAVIVVRS